MYVHLFAAFLTGSVPHVVEWFAGDIGHDPVTTCKAVLNVRIIGTKVDPCEKGGHYNVKYFKGRFCDVERRGHYTLYPSNCQCNDPEHSELIVLEKRSDIRKFSNYANPCGDCYRAIIKHMISKRRLDHGEGLAIFFDEKREGAAFALYENLVKACVKYKKENAALFKR